jgi:hypothetical protein
MCGIVGYTGKELALITKASEKLWIEKCAGKLGNLAKSVIVE